MLSYRRWFMGGLLAISLVFANMPLQASPIQQSTTIFADDFETSTGWTVNPNGSDTATVGRWERGDPEATDYQGPKQLGNAAGGTNDLVTGRLAGSDSGAYDLDGGISSIRSPSISLPLAGTFTLGFRYYLAHANNASSADYLRVKVISGSSSSTVFERLGAASDVDAAWQTASASLNSFAGQSIRIQVEAADASTSSLLEAAVDSVIVSSGTSSTPTPTTITPTPSGGVISPVPAAIVAKYNLDTRWYNKYIDAYGLPVLGSRYLQDATLLKARAQLGVILFTDTPPTVPALNRHNTWVVVVARNEKMSSIPEVYACCGTSMDARYWAGFGAGGSLRMTGTTEANLMDNQGGENVFVHEFGHTFSYWALAEVDPNFSAELNNCWNNARSKGLWRNTYANTNSQEYWAEGVQTYFNVNKEGPVGGDGVHNNINTRAELINYDRPLYNLLDRLYHGKTLP